LENIVDRGKEFDVGVEVYATVVVEYPEACVVTDKSIFAGLVCLGCVVAYIDVEVILVPEFDFMVR
jgi:hypothetical protein